MIGFTCPHACSRTWCERGEIATLPSGPLRVKVYAGLDALSGRRTYLTETIAASPTAADDAERARTRLQSQVDERRSPRTKATVRAELHRPDRVTTLTGWRHPVTRATSVPRKSESRSIRTNDPSPGGLPTESLGRDGADRARPPDGAGRASSAEPVGPTPVRCEDLLCSTGLGHDEPDCRLDDRCSWNIHDHQSLVVVRSMVNPPKIDPGRALAVTR